jgi:succinate---hydroxymethylglutarate CoA-transferase
MMNPSPGALHGIRVLDLTRVLAGPWCGMLLGDMGADVIKVESLQGDDTRSWGPPFLNGESAYYLGCNRNKRGIAVDFSGAAGKDLLKLLIARSDVVLDNFKLGTLEKWGLDDAWFEKNAPALVRCSITGYGAEGPKAGLPGYDFILQAESGLMSICGPADGPPTKYGVAVVDIATGMMAANAVQAGLISRFRTGKGQKVEVCLFDTALALLANVGNSHLATGKDARRYGNGHPTIVPYTTFPTADGSIAIAVGNDAQFKRFAELLGHPQWAADERFLKNSARINHREVIESLIAAETVRRRSDQLLQDLQENGIPSGRVNTVAEALADQHALVRHMVATVEHPEIGSFSTLGIPLRLLDTPAAVRLPPPRLGEHTEQVLNHDLGLSQEKISALIGQGVIACMTAA